MAQPQEGRDGAAVGIDRGLLSLGGVVVLGTVMTVLDVTVVTVVNVAIPRIQAIVELPAEQNAASLNAVSDAFGTSFWVALGLIAAAILPALLLPRSAQGNAQATWMPRPRRRQPHETLVA
jgi:hypothetical protein